MEELDAGAQAEAGMRPRTDIAVAASEWHEIDAR